LDNNESWNASLNGRPFSCFQPRKKTLFLESQTFFHCAIKVALNLISVALPHCSAFYGSFLQRGVSRCVFAAAFYVAFVPRRFTVRFCSAAFHGAFLHRRFTVFTGVLRCVFA
jgi:hypothetical protein